MKKIDAAAQIAQFGAELRASGTRADSSPRYPHSSHSKDPRNNRKSPGREISRQGRDSQPAGPGDSSTANSSSRKGYKRNQNTHADEFAGQKPPAKKRKTAEPSSSRPLKIPKLPPVVTDVFRALEHDEHIEAFVLDKTSEEDAPRQAHAKKPWVQHPGGKEVVSIERNGMFGHSKSSNMFGSSSATSADIILPEDALSDYKYNPYDLSSPRKQQTEKPSTPVRPAMDEIEIIGYSPIPHSESIHKSRLDGSRGSSSSKSSNPTGGTGHHRPRPPSETKSKHSSRHEGRATISPSESPPNEDEIQQKRMMEYREKLRRKVVQIWPALTTPTQRSELPKAFSALRSLVADIESQFNLLECSAKETAGAAEAMDRNMVQWQSASERCLQLSCDPQVFNSLNVVESIEDDANVLQGQSRVGEMDDEAQWDGPFQDSVISKKDAATYWHFKGY